MAAVDPIGGMKYWFFGIPFEGALRGTNDMGAMKFWYFGLVGDPVFPSGGGGVSSGKFRLTLLGAG